METKYTKTQLVTIYIGYVPCIKYSQNWSESETNKNYKQLLNVVYIVDVYLMVLYKYCSFCFLFFKMLIRLRGIGLFISMNRSI